MHWILQKEKNYCSLNVQDELKKSNNLVDLLNRYFGKVKEEIRNILDYGELGEESV